MKSRDVYMIIDSVTARVLVSLYPAYASAVRPDGTILVRLDKALYGCTESAKLWFNLLSSVLKEDGFVANEYDPCVFNKMYDGVQCTVVVYVDDLMITCANREPIDAVIALFRKRFHDLTVNEGVVHSYLA